MGSTSPKPGTQDSTIEKVIDSYELKISNLTDYQLLEYGQIRGKIV
jgi:hypothetical protein